MCIAHPLLKGPFAGNKTLNFFYCTGVFDIMNFFIKKWAC